MTFYKPCGSYMKFDILLPFSLNSVTGIRNYVGFLFVYIMFLYEWETLPFSVFVLYRPHRIAIVSCV